MNFGGTIRLNPAGLVVCVLMIVLFLLYLRSGKRPEDPEYVFQKTSLNEKVNLKKLLIAAIQAAESGGREVVKVYLNGNLNEKSKGKTFEGANDPVTDADMRSHCAMYYSLVDQFPDVKIISEEVHAREKCQTKMASATKSTADSPVETELSSNNIEANAMHAESVPVEDVTVWIDPLDATQEFTESLLDYVTTMVCVAVRGVPVMGIIHKPFGDLPQTYWSWNNHGMSSSLLLLNKARSDASETPSIMVSRSHAGTVKSELMSKLGPNIRVIPAGGAVTVS
uniref:inositol-phosphate phosphatase n=1 Tax=Cacopsylla melanoneura TaxID=428564 RepID=A0A8D9BUI0_9HEMI